MSVRDPICGMVVDSEKAEFKVEVWGRANYFCSEYYIHMDTCD